MTVDYLSASGIRKFIECPKRFHYYYLSDVNLPETEDPEHFQAGSAVHESIEEVLQDNPPLDDEDRLLERFQSEERSLDYEYPGSTEKVQTCLETASTYISKYVEDVHYIEDKWKLTYNGVDFTGYADLVCDLRIDDEVVKNVIVDWKSGSEQDQWKERLQSGVYLEMYHDEYGEYPNAFEYAYLNEGSRSTHKRIDDGEVFWNTNENKYWTEIEGHVHDILKADRQNDWPAKPDETGCYFCEYSQVCSDYVGSENVTHGEINFGI